MTVYTELIKWDSNGNIILPSLQECIENACEKSYIIDGLSRFKADNTPGGMPSEIYEMFMENNGMAHSNDVEMILEAFSTSEWQKYIKLPNCDISSVIRLQQKYKE